MNFAPNISNKGEIVQLYALDKNQMLVSAKEAIKNQDYYCLECKETLRVKKGICRQSHFFHLNIVSQCIRVKKSKIHLDIQRHIQKVLPKGECSLEKSFPYIVRP